MDSQSRNEYINNSCLMKHRSFASPPVRSSISPFPSETEALDFHNSTISLTSRTDAGSGSKSIEPKSPHTERSPGQKKNHQDMAQEVVDRVHVARIA